MSVQLLMLLLLQQGNSSTAANPNPLPASMKIRQISPDSQGIWVYLDARDASGSAIPKPDRTKMTAYLGSEQLQIQPASDQTPHGEGLALVVLVDISKSFASNLFEDMRQGLMSLVPKEGSKDRLALITFGSQVHLLAKFSDLPDSHKTAIEGLNASDSQTRLYDALKTAIETVSVQDRSLPRMRAILVLSDGKDVGSIAALTDVQTSLSQCGIPLYAMGLERKDGNSGLRILEALSEHHSEGTFMRIQNGSLVEAYTEMRRKMDETLRLNLSCPDQLYDGQSKRLELVWQLSAGRPALKASAEIRLLASDRPAKAPPPTVAKKPKSSWPWLLGSVLAVLVLAVLARIVFRRKSARFAARQSLLVPPPVPAAPIPKDPQALAPVPSPVPPSPPQPKPPRTPAFQIDLWNPSSEKRSLSFQAPLVFGRAPDCDLALSDDDLLSGHHCTFYWEQGRPMIRDLGSRNGTTVNGFPLLAPQRLEPGDLVKAGRHSLRINWEGGS